MCSCNAADNDAPATWDADAEGTLQEEATTHLEAAHEEEVGWVEEAQTIMGAAEFELDEPVMPMQVRSTSQGLMSFVEASVSGQSETQLHVSIFAAIPIAPKTLHLFQR